MHPIELPDPVLVPRVCLCSSAAGGTYIGAHVSVGFVYSHISIVANRVVYFPLRVMLWGII